METRGRVKGLAFRVSLQTGCKMLRALMGCCTDPSDTYIYLCIYVCMHVCMYVYIHTYICVYACTYACMDVCMHAYICTYTHTYIYVYRVIRAYSGLRSFSKGSLGFTVVSGLSSRLKVVLD